MPTYIYWGEEDFNIELAVKKLRDKVLDPTWATFNHKVFNTPTIQTIVEAATTIPMGFGGVLIEVHNLNLFSRKSKGKDDVNDSAESTKSPAEERDLKALIEVIEDLQDRVHLLFVVQFPRNSKKKIDKNLKITKAIEKYGHIQQFDSFKSWDEDKIVPWIKDAAGELGCKITDKAAIKLFETTGPELRKLNSELAKLSTYTGTGKTIKDTDVLELCSGIDNVFVLADKWVDGDRHDALIELYKLLDKDHPVKIIATLQTILTEWLTIKLELRYGQKSTTLAKDLGIHPYRLNKTISRLRHIAPERLLTLKDKLTSCENKIKTGQMAPELALEVLMTV